MGSASSLVTFANKPENQETFGLYPYTNPADAKDAGAYFRDVYAEFDELNVKSIRVTVEVPAGQESVGISEVKILGK